MSQLHVVLLQRAEVILGGAEQLAAFLGVPETRLHIWVRGIVIPPDAVFLRLVDLVSENPGGVHRPAAPERKADAPPVAGDPVA